MTPSEKAAKLLNQAAATKSPTKRARLIAEAEALLAAR